MLFVDDPLPGSLSRGRVFIQYRTENIRIVPVFGHVHVTVDDLPWHFVDASGETLIVVGLPPGSHEVLVELADPTHRVVARQRVAFVIPEKPPS